MLSKAVLRYSDNRGSIDGVILRFVEFQCKPNAEQARLFCGGAVWSRRSQGDSLRCTIDIYAFKVAVALDDTLAGGIVGISARLAIIR